MAQRIWLNGTTTTSASGCSSASATRRDRHGPGHRTLAAAFNAADRRHPECASLLTSLTGRRLLPSPVMTEVCWLLERWPQVEAAFLTEVARGTFELVHLTPTDLTRMGELVLQYADFPLGGVD